MKKDWTYKKLGECLSYIKNGANIKQTKGASGIPITRIETLSGGVFNRDRLGYADITDSSKYESYYLETGDLLMSHINSKTYIGRTVMYIQENAEKIIHGMNLLKLKVIKEIIEPAYLCYYCKSEKFKNDIVKIRKDAVNQSSICISDLVQFSIPIPPLSIQRSIVAELDLLHSVISKKKEQLRELDNLAQSLFYQMFGDPITNPMGCEIKKLGEVSSLLNGRAYQQKELLDQGKYRVLRVGNFFTNNTWYYSDLELPEDKYCDKGDLLFTWSASFGAHIWNGDKVIYHYHIWKIVLDEMYVDKLFYLHLLNNMVKSMMHDTHGTGMLHLTKSGMEMYDLPLPPLSLQQSFAAKVSAIEAQKQAITQSIHHTEALLAQRMDNYFG